MTTTPLPYGVRAVLRAKTVAEILDAHVSTVYKLLEAGKLEGHRVGSDIRVYADSLKAYQEGMEIQSTRRNRPQKTQQRTQTAAHKEALMFLRSVGVPSGVNLS
jgi:excisionase family DNA binding protein